MTENAAVQRQKLDRLAEEIGYEVDQAEAKFESAIDHAIRAGEKLMEAKRLVPHGTWLSWLGSNTRIGQRQAQRFMQVARNASRVSHLPTVRDALAALAEPRTAPPSVAQMREIITKANLLADQIEADNPTDQMRANVAAWRATVKWLRQNRPQVVT